MSAAAGAKAGIDGAVYRNTGSDGSPTWVEITAVRDVPFGLPWDFGDASSRFSLVKKYRKTQLDFQVQLVVRADDADVGYQLLYDTALGRGNIDLMVLDGPVTEEGAAGIRDYFELSLSGKAQMIGDVQYDTFDLKSAYNATGGSRIVDVGATSALTHTAI